MNCFTFKKLGRTLLLAAVTAVGAVCWLGCGDDNGANSGGGSTATVTIGGVKWMKNNLNVKTKDSWCYDNKAANCNKYGRYYTWEAANSACKSNGMRLPSRQDWTDLATAVGGSAKALKAKSGWNNNGNGTDSYGFSALPGGYYIPVDPAMFSMTGSYGFWWSSTFDFNGMTGEHYYTTIMSAASDDVGAGDQVSYAGLSVRCVK
jgi:uncharacterized protein (TIGR02145 family)